MKVHNINVAREKDAFVLTAERRTPLDGWQAKMFVDGVEMDGGFQCFRPDRVQMVFENPEDVVTAIGRLLRDGV